MYSLDIRFWSFHTLHIQNLSNCCRHNFNPSISRIFSSKFQQVHLTSVSSHSMHFKFKICEIVTDISTINQFSQFLEGFWHLDRLCAKRMRAIAHCLLLSIYCTLVDKVQNIMLFYVKTCLIS